MKKKIIYLRTSTEEQNPQLQLENIVSSFNIDEFEVIEEKQSAWKDEERPKFKEIYNRILTNDIEAVYVWDLDRLYRKRIKLKEFFELCKAYKCKVYSHRQSWLNKINAVPSPWNEIILNLLIDILGWLAEEESSKKSDRIKNAVRKKGNKTISYKGNRWGRKPLPKQTRDRIIELYNQGLSIRKIAGEVKTTDKNKNQKNVSRSAVHKTIQEYCMEKGSISKVDIN